MAALKIGTKIDQLYTLKLKKKDAEAVVKKIQAQITEKENDIIDTVSKEALDGAVGKLAKCTVRKSVVANITNWPDLCKYMSRYKAWDMVQKRVSLTAYRDRLEAGKKIPGVEPFTKISLSLTKVQK